MGWLRQVAQEGCRGAAGEEGDPNWIRTGFNRKAVTTSRAAVIPIVPVKQAIGLFLVMTVPNQIASQLHPNSDFFVTIQI